MGVVTSPLKRNASPADLESAGVLNQSRQHVIEFEIPGAIAAGVLKKRVYVHFVGSIVGTHMFRRTKAAGGGEGGSTDVDVNLNGTSILAATKMEVEYADGDNLTKDGALDSAHARYDAGIGGIKVQPGDYIEVEVDAIEAGGTAPNGALVQVRCLLG